MVAGTSKVASRGEKVSRKHNNAGRWLAQWLVVRQLDKAHGSPSASASSTTTH